MHEEGSHQARPKSARLAGELVYGHVDEHWDDSRRRPFWAAPFLKIGAGYALAFDIRSAEAIYIYMLSGGARPKPSAAVQYYDKAVLTSKFPRRLTRYLFLRRVTNIHFGSLLNNTFPH